jgi:anti-sigma factor RsiW
MNCVEMKNKMPDLLLDPDQQNSATADHLAACADCRDELAGLRATMALMDEWTAPNLSPYFETRMAARLRDAQNAPPAGWWQRIRERMSFGEGLHAKPVLAGVLALAIVVVGGAYEGIQFFEQPQPSTEASATISDLQSMDKNSQTLEEIDSLDQTVIHDSNTDAAQ